MDKVRYQKEIAEIVNQIKEGYKPERIILFGSFAAGQAKESSDVDLVVIKKTRKRMLERLKEVIKSIRSDLGTDILVYTPKEWKERIEEENYFIQEILATGKVVYEKQS